MNQLKTVEINKKCYIAFRMLVFIVMNSMKY